MQMEIYQYILHLNTVRIDGILLFKKKKYEEIVKLSFEFLCADKEKMVKILIDAKADTIDVKNVNGTTPLIAAADKGMMI